MESNSDNQCHKRSLESQTVGLTLKEKLAQHSANRDFTVTPETANIWGVLLFFWCNFSGPALLIFYLIPFHYPDVTWSTYLCQVVFIIFLFIQCLFNWRACLIAGHDDLVDCVECKSKGREKIIPEPPSSIPEQQLCKKWYFCAVCNANCPPRSHHCKVCKSCILKRDHHCFFVGRCIGFHNQRHYIVLCFYCALLAAIFLHQTFHYLLKESPLFGGESFFQFNFDYFFPIAFLHFLTGQVSFFFLFCLFQLHLGAAVGCIAVFYFFWEIYLVYLGVTTHEMGHFITTYQMTTSNNIKSVFGNYALLSFFWPIRTEQYGDGYHWMIHSTRVKHS